MSLIHPNPRPSFIAAVKSCLKNYAIFKGRARRSEYWWFVLFSFINYTIVSFAIEFILGLLAGIAGGGSVVVTFAVRVVNLLLWLALLLPSLAVGVRRLHDTGKSGWNILWGIVPFVGALCPLIFNLSGIDYNGWIFAWNYPAQLAWIYLLILFLRDSDPNENEYGPSPKYGTPIKEEDAEVK